MNFPMNCPNTYLGGRNETNCMKSFLGIDPDAEYPQDVFAGIMEADFLLHAYLRVVLMRSRD